MLGIELSGKRAFVVGVADDAGFGFAIAKQLAEAGASVCVGTWPPAYGVFTKLLGRGKIQESLKLAGGGELAFERIYAIDVDYDTLEDVPTELRENRRYKAHGDFTVGGVAAQVVGEFGERPLDLVVHSVANGPEVNRPLLETTRQGYLAAVSASSYSFVSLVQRFGPLLRPDGAFVCLTYLASQRVVSGYGGGMSSAKAALESDTRLLAYEAGHRRHRDDGGARSPDLAPPGADSRRRGRERGGVPAESPRLGHHRNSAVRGQGVSRDGGPARGHLTGAGFLPRPADRSR
jgi:enoyl-[acyl-carrier protein] reductase I